LPRLQAAEREEKREEEKSSRSCTLDAGKKKREVRAGSCGHLWTQIAVESGQKKKKKEKGRQVRLGRSEKKKRRPRFSTWLAPMISTSPGRDKKKERREEG